MAEIRLDLARLDDSEIVKIFKTPIELVATCRPGKIPDAERLRILKLAISSGASYVDVEMESAPAFLRKVIATTKRAGAKVIISHHDTKWTPPTKELRKIVAGARRLGADVVKVACLARNRTDNARLLGLLDDADDVVVVGLGIKGRTTRLAAPLLGAPFTYAAPDEGRRTEPGQLTLAETVHFYEMLGAMD